MNKILLLTCFATLFISFHAAAQKLSESETRATFKFVFGSDDIDQVTAEDKKKAIFFIRELIQKSCAMSLAEGMLRGTASPAYSVRKLITKLATTAQCGHEEIEEGKIYKVVRDELKRKWRSAYRIRCNDGDW